MRTDSTTLSETALTAARDQARELYGADYVPAQPRRYERKVKNAQEAHEAIRPAGDTFRTPQQVAGELSPDERALYELIWIRTIASQMKDAAGQTVSLRIARSGTDARFDDELQGVRLREERIERGCRVRAVRQPLSGREPPVAPRGEQPLPFAGISRVGASDTRPMAGNYFQNGQYGC